MQHATQAHVQAQHVKEGRTEQDLEKRIAKCKLCQKSAHSGLGPLFLCHVHRRMKNELEDFLAGDMPRALTVSQADRYKEFHSFDDDTKASAFATASGGQVYTQVDTESDVAYCRGFHLVNRTGFYLVLLRQPLSPQAQAAVDACACSTCHMNNRGKFRVQGRGPSA